MTVRCSIVNSCLVTQTAHYSLSCPFNVIYHVSSSCKEVNDHGIPLSSDDSDSLKL